MDRRFFLKGAALIGCSAAAMPLFTPVSFAAMPGENRLVVIILRGAMDGLDVVQPYGDPDLRRLRPALSMGPQGGALDLDGFYAMHPALKSLMPLWQKGQLAFAHAVATPYRDKRSHFDGQDLLEAGIAGNGPVPSSQDGWLNRLLQTMPETSAETAWSVGAQEMLLLAGRAPIRSWEPDTDLALTPQAQLLLGQVYHDDPLFRQAAEAAIEIDTRATEVMNADAAPQAKDAPRPSNAARLAAYSAARLNEEARIASFSITGWDSHKNQPGVLGGALKQLAEAILTLQRDLGPHWDRTTVMALTEFGRTVRQNGTQGTDHGTGGAMLMAGGAVRGGRVYGDWPGLADGKLFEDRDLMPTRDVRAYPAWAMAGLFGIDATRLTGTVFPGLDLGQNPGILL
ncbi:DUF1501 domain-containing protein [Paracoccus suum]|uniref:DUF1501 domain-containing protein n=1 Tax=Paracoccus suum TaxID=2259340 RepID=A0A344PGW0_9RHOB|nr:DUF1501 domain-containing protein [Paracoccus suum]AXC48615.1 DUF1501 domain-containing protein [Paracoccus suum]